MIAVYVLGPVLLYFIVVNTIICRYFKKAANNNGQKRDVMIVLGCPAKKDGNVSPALRERINKAAELYHGGVAGTIICSGAAVANGYIEADVIAEALIALGVPDTNIIREKLAQDTYENMVNSKRIMQDRKLNTAVILSSPWHLRKASTFASKLGISHTVEKSKLPYEYLGVGAAVIYLYVYTLMIINLMRDRKNGK